GPWPRRRACAHGAAARLGDGGRLSADRRVVRRATHDGPRRLRTHGVRAVRRAHRGGRGPEPRVRFHKGARAIDDRSSSVGVTCFGPLTERGCSTIVAPIRTRGGAYGLPDIHREACVGGGGRARAERRR